MSKTWIDNCVATTAMQSDDAAVRVTCMTYDNNHGGGKKCKQKTLF